MADESNDRTLIEAALEIWRRRKWLLMVSFLAVFGLVAGLVSALPDLYRSSTTLIMGQDDVTESLVENNVSTELELRLGIIRQALMSRGQLQEVIEQFNLYEDMRKTQPPASVIERLRQDIDIEQEAYAQPQWGQSATFAVTISYQAWDPDLAARVANDLAMRFQAENERRRSTQATRATDIIREQLEVARDKFLAQEQRITAFRNEHMGNLPEQQGVNLATLARLNSELLLNGERQMQLSERKGAMLAAAVAGATTTNTIVPDRLRLEQLRRELDQLEEKYTGSHPEIIRLEREIQTLSLELANAAPAGGSQEGLQDVNPAEVDRDMDRLKANELRLQAAINALTQRIEGIPRIEQQLNRLTYDYDATREEFLELQKRYGDAVLAQSLEAEQNQEVKIVEVAIPPDFPSAPQKSRLLFVGMVLAGGFSAALLLLAEQLNKTFHATRDLRKFTRVPVLASIGKIQTSRDRWIGRARFGMYATLVIGGLFLITAASYRLGQGGEQLVLAISG
jgi:polysaccharide chain length determinant protein (PEP-CTERM system associated)